MRLSSIYLSTVSGGILVASVPVSISELVHIDTTPTYIPGVHQTIVLCTVVDQLPF